MTRKCVLIVDDSKTAQIRLRKMLKHYDVDVEAAFSAEEALGLLSYRSPAVIFMDHHMEGMDGFEALKIIKANPSTAMIPVIMYTAQKGDVYVGQARALGALDILSKEVIKPANLERVLSSLSIAPVGKEEEAGKSEASEATTNAESAAVESSSVGDEVAAPTTAPDRHVESVTAEAAAAPASLDAMPASVADIEQIKVQVARLFELHIADVRNQIAENAKFTVRRVTSELKESVAKIDYNPIIETPEDEQAPASRGAIISNGVLIVLVLGLFLMGYELLKTKRNLMSITQGYVELLELTRAENELLLELADSVNNNGVSNAVSEDDINADMLMSSLSWALDVDTSFGYGEAPLNEENVSHVSNLVYSLSSAGFRGAVNIEIHYGNFCLVMAPSGQWRIADHDTNVSECTFYEDIEPDLSSGNFLSVAYLTFEQTAQPIEDGEIEMEISSMGFDVPVKPYPQGGGQMTAGEWNMVARANNRLAFSFSF